MYLTYTSCKSLQWRYMHRCTSVWENYFFCLLTLQSSFISLICHTYLFWCAKMWYCSTICCHVATKSLLIANKALETKCFFKQSKAKMALGHIWHKMATIESQMESLSSSIIYIYIYKEKKKTSIQNRIIMCILGYSIYFTENDTHRRM